jgi:hypothetical protein
MWMLDEQHKISLKLVEHKIYTTVERCILQWELTCQGVGLYVLTHCPDCVCRGRDSATVGFVEYHWYRWRDGSSTALLAATKQSLQKKRKKVHMSSQLYTNFNPTVGFGQVEVFEKSNVSIGLTNFNMIGARKTTPPLIELSDDAHVTNSEPHSNVHQVLDGCQNGRTVDEVRMRLTTWQQDFRLKRFDSTNKQTLCIENVDGYEFGQHQTYLINNDVVMVLRIRALGPLTRACKSTRPLSEVICHLVWYVWCWNIKEDLWVCVNGFNVGWETFGRWWVCKM